MKIRTEIDAWFDKHADEMLEDVKRLIAVKSVLAPAEPGKPYGAGPHAALTLAREMLAAHGIETTVFADCMAQGDIGPGAPELGILVHVDTVAAHDGWDSDPFTAEVRGGRLYGRGATDNKGPAVASMYAMYAARELAPQLKKAARILIGSAEEIGCVDIAAYLRENAPPPCVFSPDADYPLVNVEKGRYCQYFEAKWESDGALPRVVSVTGGDTENIVPRVSSAVVEGVPLHAIQALCAEYSEKTGAELTAEASGDTVKIMSKGTASHASRPQDGNNAQTALLALLAALPLAESESAKRVRALARMFPHGDTEGHALGIAMEDEISHGLTLNFGVVTLSETGLRGNFDSRTPACADDRDIAGIVDRALFDAGILTTGKTMTRCHHTPADSPCVRTLLRIYADYTGEKGECLALGGTTYVHNIPGGVAFGCEMPGESNRIHGANEYIGVEQLILSAKMFTQAILDICG
jgi:succinyl-diaminopimelate desuccinylase